ncbi:MAG: chorismate mutase [Clostridia bacterium]|nr:chorismate mutase [Clostridia bacterium]
MSDKLIKAREIINRVDMEMARLFEERMSAAAMIADYKKERGIGIYDAAREAEIIRRGSERISDPVVREYYVNYLKSTMEVSRRYQARLIEGMRVAYCGTEGAFAHIATMKLYPTAKKIAYSTFDEAYSSVVNGDCDVVVLPVENSYNGEVGQVTDLMFQGSLYLTEMTELAVTQDLLVIPGTKISEVKEVVSHTQALGQCQEFIREHGFIASEYSNTALAAKYVSEKGDPSVAAIASAEAAEIFGLEVLERNINASRNNTTRFAVFSRIENERAEKAVGVHTVILFTVRNEAGALAKAIDIIGKHGFNMKSLRSRPMKELLWEYYFYVEADGNVNTDEGREMMRELSEYCDKLRAIGTYINM